MKRGEESGEGSERYAIVVEVAQSDGALRERCAELGRCDDALDEGHLPTPFTHSLARLTTTLLAEWQGDAIT